MSSFVELLLRGEALEDDLDLYVAEWHEAPSESPAASQELHEHLGMTWDEYRLVTEQPRALRFVLAARKAQRPLDQVLRTEKELALAARASSDSDAAAVLQWLIDSGRIEA